MMSLLLHWVIVAGSILLTSHLVPGIRADGWKSALITALVLGALNIFLKPLLILLTLPLTIVTLGLFLLVVNAIVLIVAGKLVSGFRVDGFAAAFVGSIVISLCSYVAGRLLGDGSSSVSSTRHSETEQRS